MTQTQNEPMNRKTLLDAEWLEKGQESTLPGSQLEGKQDHVTNFLLGLWQVSNSRGVSVN
jgi:hypothetical protein